MAVVMKDNPEQIAESIREKDATDMLLLASVLRKMTYAGLAAAAMDLHEIVGSGKLSPDVLLKWADNVIDAAVDRHKVTRAESLT